MKSEDSTHHHESVQLTPDAPSRFTMPQIAFHITVTQSEHEHQQQRHHGSFKIIDTMKTIKNISQQHRHAFLQPK
jgi:hypothetical protein